MLSLLQKLRVWLAGIIYPGDARGLISYKDGQWIIDNIRFDDVMVENKDYAIMIIPHKLEHHNSRCSVVPEYIPTDDIQDKTGLLFDSASGEWLGSNSHGMEAYLRRLHNDK